MVLGPHKKKAEAKVEQGRQGRAAPPERRPEVPSTERAATAQRPRPGSRARSRLDPDMDPTDPTARIETRRRTMPKNKTHSGASKRFRVTGSGKMRRQKAGLRHNLEHKSSKLTRRMAAPPRSSKADTRAGQEAARPLTPAVQPASDPSSNSRSNTVARVKRAVNAHKKRRVTLERASRLPRPALAAVPQGQGAGHPLARLRLPRPQGAQGRLPQAVDPAHQRRGPRQRHDLQPLHPGPAGLAGVEVDRKMLADLAVNDAAAFTALVEIAKARPARATSTRRPSGLSAAEARARHVTPSRVPDASSRRALLTPRSGRVRRHGELARRAAPGRAPAVPGRGAAGRPRGAGRRPAACGGLRDPRRRPRTPTSRAADAPELPWHLVDDAALAVADRDRDAAGRGGGLPVRRRTPGRRARTRSRGWSPSAPRSATPATPAR